MKKAMAVAAFAALSAASGMAHAATGYQGWWWDASKNGMGLNIAQQGDTMAVAWYHFDPDHSSSYVLLAGKLEGGVLAGELQTASGPPPGPGYDPAAVGRGVAGAGKIRFTSDSTAVFEYTLNGQGGSLNLGRFALPDPRKASLWSYSMTGTGCARGTGSGIAGVQKISSQYYDIFIHGYGGYPYCEYSMVSDRPGSTATYQCVLDQAGHRSWGTTQAHLLKLENRSFTFQYIEQTSFSATQPTTPYCPGDKTWTITGTTFVEDETFLSGWWWDPSQSGMGVNIEEKNGTIALAWYHFDENGTPAYALLAGAQGESSISGSLQGASGPPPGPGYKPSGVSTRNTGTGTLALSADPATLKFSMTFDYALKGRTGSLNLVPFILQELPPPTAGFWNYATNYLRYSSGTQLNRAFGAVALEKTAESSYRLTTHSSNGVESCVYNLDVEQGGGGFFGTGRVACRDANGSPVEGVVFVDRLQTEHGILVFNYVTSYQTKYARHPGDSVGSSGEMGTLTGTR